MFLILYRCIIQISYFNLEIIETRENLIISFIEFLIFLFKKKPGCSKNNNNLKLTSFLDTFINQCVYVYDNKQ